MKYKSDSSAGGAVSVGKPLSRCDSELGRQQSSRRQESIETLNRLSATSRLDESTRGLFARMVYPYQLSARLLNKAFLKQLLRSRKYRGLSTTNTKGLNKRKTRRIHQMKFNCIMHRAYYVLERPQM